MNLWVLGVRDLEKHVFMKCLFVYPACIIEKVHEVIHGIEPNLHCRLWPVGPVEIKYFSSRSAVTVIFEPF